MTVHDGHRLPNALDDLADRSLTPKMLLGDSYYGSADNMALAENCAVDLVAPACTAKGRSSGRMTLEDFSLDDDGLVLQCPNGIKPVSTSAATAKLQARFDLSICRAARCRPPDMTDNSPAFNTRPSGRQTRNDDFARAAMHFEKSIAGARTSKRRCHGSNIR